MSRDSTTHEQASYNNATQRSRINNKTIRAHKHTKSTLQPTISMTKKMINDEPLHGTLKVK